MLAMLFGGHIYIEVTYRILAYLLLLLSEARSLDAVTGLDNVGLEAYRARATVQLEEEAAGVAEDGSDLIASPKRCC